MKRKLRLLTDSEYKKTQSINKLEADIIREATKIKRVMRSDAEKIEVVKTYLALGGDHNLTSKITGVNWDTLKAWRASNWWKLLVNEVRQAEKLKLSAKTKKILNAAMEVLADRVDNGDFIYNQKTGELVRKPLTAKDAHTISSDLIERSVILDKETEEPGDEKETDSQRLKNLAARFAQLANKQDQILDTLKQKPPVIVTDVIFQEEDKKHDLPTT